VLFVIIAHLRKFIGWLRLLVRLLGTTALLTLVVYLADYFWDMVEFFRSVFKVNHPGTPPCTMHSFRLFFSLSRVTRVTDCRDS
jgi:hypothetical protein